MKIKLYIYTHPHSYCNMKQLLLGVANDPPNLYPSDLSTIKFIQSIHQTIFFNGLYSIHPFKNMDSIHLTYF